MRELGRPAGRRGARGARPRCPACRQYLTIDDVPPTRSFLAPFGVFFVFMGLLIGAQFLVPDELCGRQACDAVGAEVWEPWVAPLLSVSNLLLGALILT